MRFSEEVKHVIYKGFECLRYFLLFSLKNGECILEIDTNNAFYETNILCCSYKIIKLNDFVEIFGDLH